MTKIISLSAFSKLLTGFCFPNLHQKQLENENRNEDENHFACCDFIYFLHNLG